MDKNLLQKAKAPMIALIQTKNIMRTNNLKTKMKRTFAALLLFALLAPTAAWAQFSGGSGLWHDPYIIKTIDDMTKLANDVNGGNSYSSKHFRLEADLDYKNETYVIIGDHYVNSNCSFEGVFDGNFHTISNVTLDRTTPPSSSTGHPSSYNIHIGLFGQLNPSSWGTQVKNLTLSKSAIRGRNGVGGIAGRLNGGFGSAAIPIHIENCHVTSDVTIEIVDMSGQDSGNVGGIVGIIANGLANVWNCTSAATIVATSTTTAIIGGIVGGSSTPSGEVKIEGNAFTGTISGGSSYVGGILGCNFNNSATFNENNFVGGGCTLGAVGVEGSTQGTDEGAGAIQHIYSIGFNSAQITSGTIDTPPTKTVSGTNYYADGSTITLSNVSTFGTPGGGKMWTYRAFVNNSNETEAFPQEDGTWQFTMPIGNVLIVPEGVIDITLTGYPYNTSITFTPANATYTGSALHPTVSVVERGNELVEGTHFFTDIPAAGFTYPGDYTVHVWGMGSYGGLRTETFTIAPASLTSFTIEPAMVYFDGEAHTPTLTVKSGSKTLSLGTEYETDLPDEGFTDLGDHIIKAWGIGNYTDTLTATFTIQHPWSGMGTWNQPFLIQNTDDMDLLASFVNGGKDYNGVYFRQAANLDYTGKTYTPVGCYEEKPFQGTFEGSMYTITGINASGYEYIGVFGYVGSNATLRSVTLVDYNRFTGTASGHCGSIAAMNRGYLENCSVAEGADIMVTASTAGGIVGQNYGTINSCTNHAANVQASCAGGVVGFNIANDGYVMGTNYATIESTQIAGGICGVNMKGTITGQHFGTLLLGTICGGIVGHNYDIVEHSLSTDLMTSVGDGGNKGAIIGKNEASGYASFNYYIGACEFGGINDSDMFLKAMRGWPIIADEIVNFNPDYSVGTVPGTYYNDEAANTNHYYVGAGESIRFTLGSSEYVNTQYQANGTILTAAGTNEYGETYYVMEMPAQEVTITIAGTITIELLDDDSQDFYDNEHRLSNHVGQARNVLISGRTLYKDGRWNLLCLPFALTSLTGTPLEDAEVRTFAATSTYANGNLTLNFTDPISATEAGKPYLVRWSSGDNVTDPVFNNVTIDENMPSIENTDGNIRFVGNFSNTTLDANTTEYLYFGDDGLLHYPYGTDYSLNALRGHFEITLENNVQVGTCNVNLGTTDTYNMLPAIFQTTGDWNVAANWNTGALPTQGADVLLLANAEVPSGYVANAGTIVRGGYSGSFTVKDGGQLYHTNDDLYATVEKVIEGYSDNNNNDGGWNLIASPLAESLWPQEWNGFLANEYDLYFYEEPTHHWRNHKPNGQYANFNIEPLKGYLYANNQDVTLVFAGNLRAGNAMVNVPLYYTPTAGILKGFNLVGNPFAHNVTSFTGSNVATEVYRMNETMDEITVGTLSENNPLKPGEGFFVKATGYEASITFNSRATNAERSDITLEISENGLLVDRFILKRDGAPLEKFTLNENSTRVYATEGAQDWAVAVIASEAKQSSRTEQPVNFKAAKNGTYTLTVNMENMELDYLHLIDNMTGTDVDLLAVEPVETPTSGNGPSTSSGTVASYTFTAKTTDYASRFRLVFDANDASTGSASDAPFAYINNGNIIINGTGTLQIIDILGKELERKELSTLNSQLSTLNFVPGVYVLRLIDGDSIRTQKMIVE